jgi:hypothetical protein
VLPIREIAPVRDCAISTPIPTKRFVVSELVTYCVLPFARRDDGVIVPDHHGVVECASAKAAAQLAEAMAHADGYVAALAFARTGSPAAGEYGPTALLKRAGRVHWCPKRQAWID